MNKKLSRYSSLWTFAKQDLRLLLFFLIIAGLVGLELGISGAVFLLPLWCFLHFSCVLYIWSMTGLPIIHTMSLRTSTEFGGIII